MIEVSNPPEYANTTLWTSTSDIFSSISSMPGPRPRASPARPPLTLAKTKSPPGLRTAGRASRAAFAALRSARALPPPDRDLAIGTGAQGAGRGGGHVVTRVGQESGIVKEQSTRPGAHGITRSATT